MQFWGPCSKDKRKTVWFPLSVFLHHHFHRQTCQILRHRCQYWPCFYWLSDPLKAFSCLFQTLCQLPLPDLHSWFVRLQPRLSYDCSGCAPPGAWHLNTADHSLDIWTSSLQREWAGCEFQYDFASVWHQGSAGCIFRTWGQKRNDQKITLSYSFLP